MEKILVEKDECSIYIDGKLHCVVKKFMAIEVIKFLEEFNTGQEVYCPENFKKGEEL